MWWGHAVIVAVSLLGGPPEGAGEPVGRLKYEETREEVETTAAG